MRRFPHIPRSDDDPLILTKKEKHNLAKLNSQLSGIHRKKVLYLREIARKNGIIASTLEELKSKSGKPFVEVKSKRTFGRDYREAVAKEEVLGSKSKLHFEIREQAYLCHEMYSKEDTDSCGWVKGIPVEKEYDDIGILSGSAGTQYYCKICGKMIGEHRMIMSLK